MDNATHTAPNAALERLRRMHEQKRAAQSLIAVQLEGRVGQRRKNELHAESRIVSEEIEALAVAIEALAAIGR